MSVIVDRDEVERLRARVAELESELATQAARTNALLADAQRRTYWLDRLNLDLDVTLGRPPVRLALLGALSAVRRLRRLRGRVRRLLAR
jgi:hypothetical protein